MKGSLLTLISLFRSPWRWFRRSWPDWACVALLVALALAFLWRVVALGHILAPLDLVLSIEPWRSEVQGLAARPVWNDVPSDVVFQYLPMAFFVKDALQHGQLAMWSPDVLSGMPVLAVGSWMVLYPPAVILYLVLPAAQALSWLAVVHLALGGIFMFLLLREMQVGRFGALVGAVTFAFSGYMVSWLANASHPASLIWSPLVLWGVERARRRRRWYWSLVGTLAFAFQVLGGNPMRAFHAATAIGLLVLYRAGMGWWEERKIQDVARTLVYGGLALVAGAMLAAPQLLPTVELYSLSTRKASAPLEPLAIQYMIRLGVPDFYGNPLDRNYTGEVNYQETNLYLGILPLVFVAASVFSTRRRLAWGFAAVGLLFLLAIFGIRPFYTLFYYFYPTFQSQDVTPGRLFDVTAFAWAVAAGLGADWIVTARPANFLRRLNLFLIPLLGFVFASSLWLVLWQKYQARFYWGLDRQGTPEPGQLLTSSSYQSVGLLVAFALLLVTILLMNGWRMGTLKWPWFAGLTLLLVAADLVLAGLDYLPAFDPKLMYPTTPSLQFLESLTKEDPRPYRVLPISSAWPSFLLTEDAATVYHIPGPQGRSSWLLERYARYVNLTGERYYTQTPIRVDFSGYDSRLLDALNTRYLYWAPPTPWHQDLIPTLRILQSPAPDAVGLVEWTIDGSAKQVLFEHAPSSVQVSAQSFPQKGIVLKTAVAVQPEAWEKAGDGVVFKLYLTTPRQQSPQLLFSRYIDPKHNPSERHWLPVEIDLSSYVESGCFNVDRFAEQPCLDLVFVTEPGPSNNYDYDWAGWAEPVLETKMVDLSKPQVTLLHDGPNKIYRNESALPRAWIVHSVVEVTPNDLDAVEAHLRSAEFDPAAEAVIEGNLPGQGGAPSPGDQVEITEYSADKVTIQAELADSGLLVLSDTIYPGWKAYVDAVEQPIYATNLTMRGVYVNGGHHEVVFKFESETFRQGLYVSAAIAGLILVGCALEIVNRVRRRGAARGSTAPFSNAPD